MIKKSFLLALSMLFMIACSNDTSKEAKEENKAPFVWENANVYFLMTDRFCNGDKSNDVNFGRTAETTELRKFMGGDIKGNYSKD
jgi:alpha-amylase